MTKFSYSETREIPGAPFEFGWEAEYHPSKTAALLENYEPLDASWGERTTADKIGWLQNQISSLPLGNRDALLRRAPGANPLLPELAYRDDTGNIEVRSGPFPSFESAMQSLNSVCSELGTGSLQLTISQPTERFFRQGAEPQLGWLCFFAEIDVLDRLARGQEWRRNGYKGEPARNFLHAFLGPLNRRRKKMLVEFIRENANGNLWSSEDLFWAGRKDKSFKFVGSTAYRPDVAGPARICFEVRDAHRDLQLLEARARRVLYYWNGDVAAFADFSQPSAFDQETDFELLSPAVRETLTRLFPCRAPLALHSFRTSLLMHEVYRNFAFPLRASWGGWLALLGIAPECIRAHQDEYRETLERVALYGVERTAEARLEIQDALCRFAAESPVYPAFLKKERELAELCRPGSV